MNPSVTQISQHRVTPLVSSVQLAFSEALAGKSAIDERALRIGGMSGGRYRRFINNLVRNTPDPRYLEVGAWKGSTLCAAINGNSVRSTVIDNWSQFGGPRDKFIANVVQFKTPKAYVNIIEQDFRKVNFAELGTFNIYLFDGPHEAVDQYDGIVIAQPALDHEFVLIIDDWNWSQVREGTFKALNDLNLGILFALEIRTTLDNTQPALIGWESEWHNGYFIAVMERR